MACPGALRARRRALRRPTAAATPTWAGHWTSQIQCPLPACASEPPTSGSLDIVQSGSSLTGTMTSASSGESGPLTRVANGGRATIDIVLPGFTDVFDVTLSPDGASFTGTVTAVDQSAANTLLFGTISSTRAQPPTLSVELSAAVPPRGLRVGATLAVTAKVTAHSASLHDLSLSELGISPKALAVKPAAGRQSRTAEVVIAEASADA